LADSRPLFENGWVLEKFRNDSENDSDRESDSDKSVQKEIQSDIQDMTSEVKSSCEGQVETDNAEGQRLAVTEDITDIKFGNRTVDVSGTPSITALSSPGAKMVGAARLLALLI
jgi:hypothetical protein